MNNLDNLSFLDLVKKASSKDYNAVTDFHSPEFNPETDFEGDLIDGVWRTNLLIEGEEERKSKTLLLCKMTSFEDHFKNTSFFKELETTQNPE